MRTSDRARGVPVRAFVRCEACNGMGFVALGDWYERSYMRCDVCKGLGEIDYAPVSYSSYVP
jgi:DnaJ-class molecular chaperone